MNPDIFESQPILENERVLLRAIQEDDIRYLLPYSIHEPEIWKYSLTTAAREENLKKYIQSTIANKLNKTEYAFIVFDKKSNCFAGCTRFYDIQQQYQTTQLGYTWYGIEFQRTGLNRHCKLLLLTYAFEEWGMERVEFRADALNEKSILAMHAIGCVQEGTLRKNMPTVAGTRRDSVVLSILKEEWFSKVKKNLLQKTY